MKHDQFFGEFLANHVNLNQTRLDHLDEHVRAVSGYLANNLTGYERVERQGSYALGTIIKPVRDGQEYDADLLLLVAYQPEQGAANAGMGCSCSCEACAPADVEQHCLGAVIRGVAHQHVGGQRPVAGGASPRLQVGAGLDTHPAELETGSEAGRDGLRRLHVGTGRGAQPVVHMPSGDLQPGRGGQRDQRGGVRPARQAAGHGGTGRRERAAGQQRFDAHGRGLSARCPGHAAPRRLRLLPP